MARFTHPSIGSGGSSEAGTWIIEGGTAGTDAVQPTFDGDPLFSGRWKKFDSFVHFAIDVDFDNILTFGGGQYYMKLPYPAKSNYLFSDGCVHDSSTGDEYAILAHVNAGSDIMTLLSTASNGRQVPFTDKVPFTLNSADNFHIAGNYEADLSS
jgi:hypothetical protein